MLEIEDLSKSFGKKEILHNISCNLGNGVYGLLGPNVPRYELKTAFII